MEQLGRLVRHGTRSLLSVVVVTGCGSGAGAGFSGGAAFANIWNGLHIYGIPPSDGSTYPRLALSPGVTRDAAAPTPAAVTQRLCAPLAAGSAGGLELDLANESQDSLSGGVVQLLGGTSACSAGQVLWTSPRVTANGWNRYCAPLAPAADVSYLSFALVDPTGQGAAVYVDNLVPVAQCP